MAVILGGGLAGLSAGYYALQNPKINSIVLIEASNRLGGWIRSQKSPSGALFEQGPRTVRVAGPSGKNTLFLLDRLNLSDKIIPINHLHPASYNRMIYVKNTMVTLPNNLSTLFTLTPPFTKKLFNVFAMEIFKKKVKLEDDTIHNFVMRRYGQEVADYLAGPMIAGIFAGDSKQLSIKSFANNLFQCEQEYNSIIKGLLWKKLREKKKPPEKPNFNVEVLMSDTVNKAKNQRWTMWTLKDGLEVLPKTLSKNIKQLGVDIRLDTPCEKVNFKSNGVEVITHAKSDNFSQIISALPAWELAKLLKHQHPQLAEELEGIPAVDVGVVNLEFTGKVIYKRGFGCLVAPIENRPILGVIFDSGIDPTNDEYTTLTVMMGGFWYDKYFKNATEKDLLSVALFQVKDILKIKADPISHNVSILRKCIPQYIVGHNSRLERINNYISTNKLPLLLCGSSYEGVGINDVISSAKTAVNKIQ